jgi:hypothetical protein
LYSGINYNDWNEMPQWVAGFVVEHRDMVCGDGFAWRPSLSWRMGRAFGG